MEVPAFSFQSRWRRPGKRRDLLSWLYDGDAGIAGGGPNPDASPQSERDFAARNRYQV